MNDDVSTPSNLLNKLSQALILVSRGDPLVSLRTELQTEFRAINTRFAGIDKATELQHDDLVRVPTQVDRAVGGLREFVEQVIATSVAQTNVTIARIDGKIDRQIAETSEKINGWSEVTNEKIKSLSDVTTQQFKSIDDRFAEKDKGVIVGLSAQKESAAAQQQANSDATAKMEANFTTLINQLANLFQEMRRNSEVQMNDLKGRMTTAENRRDPIVDSLLARMTAVENRRDGVREESGDMSRAAQHQTQSAGVIVAAIAVGISVLAIITTIVIAIIISRPVEVRSSAGKVAGAEQVNTRRTESAVFPPPPASVSVFVPPRSVISPYWA